MAVGVGVGCGGRLWWWPSEGVLVAVGAGLVAVGVADGAGWLDEAVGELLGRGEWVGPRVSVAPLVGVIEGITVSVGLGWFGGQAGLVKPTQSGRQVGGPVGVSVAVGVTVGVGGGFGSLVGVGHGIVG